LRKLLRKRQKQALRHVIAEHRKDTDLMSDPKTERLPLIITG
jgi:hypothetical protein